MHKFVRIRLWVCLWGALQQPAILRAQAIPEPPRPRMNVAVVEGQGALNNVRSREDKNIVVIIRDGNRRPIPQASVTFTVAAEDGAGASFADGATTVTVESDKDGYARVQGIRGNSVPGSYRIHIKATHNGETAAAVVTQFNMRVASHSGSGKWVAIVAVLGAAAAGGTIALTRNGGHGGTPASVASVPIGIAPGSGTVGPPN